MIFRSYLKVKSLIRTLAYWLSLAVVLVRQRWWASASLAALVLILWGSVFYFLGYTALKNQVQATYNATFLPAVQSDSSDAWEIFSQLNMITTQVKLLEQNIRNLSATLEQKESTIAKLKEQLYFYRVIVAPEDNKEGLSIFSAKLGRPYQEGGFPFEIILRKHGKSNVKHRGSITITLSDGDGGSARSLPMKKFYKGDTKFSFRYFQSLEGVISIPEGFSPVKVNVRVLRRGKSTIEKDWYWGDLFAGNHAHK